MYGIHRGLVATAIALGAMGLVAASGCSRRSGNDGRAKSVPGDDGPQSAHAPLTILYPFDEAVFPPEIVAPTFRWEDGHPGVNTWLITFDFQDAEGPLQFRSRAAEWTVPDEAWEGIRARSTGKPVELKIEGVYGGAAERILSQASVTISTSEDEVGAPLFFREVNLPFLTAVKNPAAHIRWRFGPISSREPPPVVLDKLPVCGNCHSFSADGSTLAMEVDSGNDKGSYAIVPVEKEIVLDKTRIITWSDFRREDGELTFGLLCQASPDGRYVVGTVKDRALAVYRPNLTFSQLFFLVKGILAIYDRKTETFRPLSGADDPRYVQTNATWSPDGESLVYARCEAYEVEGVEDVKSVLLPQEAAREFTEGGRLFRYDLYRIPFNGGEGGEPEPVEGASHNGRSNYFPKFSPDGKWIVFCQANSFMLLQPDSELYIIPAEGGQARRLRCNTSRMNSWHSWSPNGRWLVFSSKVFTPYTQLFLTHVDEQGFTTPPVVLSRFTIADRAANIPEFANVQPDAIKKISAAFLDDHNLFRAAVEFVKQGDFDGSIPLFLKSLEMNPGNVKSRVRLAGILAGRGETEQAEIHLTRALEYQPDHPEAHHRLAVILNQKGKTDEAESHCREALRIVPAYFDAQMTLGLILLERGQREEGVAHLAEAIRLNPDDVFANYYYGQALHQEGKLVEAMDHYRRASEQAPEFVPALLGLAALRMMAEREELYDLEEAITLAEKACEASRFQDPVALDVLGSAYALTKRLDAAIETASKALQIARELGETDLALRIEQKLALYRRAAAEERP